MHYSFLRELISSPWQVDPVTAQIYAPVLKGVFSGLHFEREDTKPLSYSLNTPASASGDSKNQINVVEIRGVMLKHDTESGECGMRTVANIILNKDKQVDVIGHIMVFESGGGQASAVPELADAIKKLNKPVVAFVDGMMCSAAYMPAAIVKKLLLRGLLIMLDVSVR
jgi:protease-4